MTDEEGLWRDRVATARRRGDHLATFDAAIEGLAACPESPPLHYAATLALARSGATRGARALLDRIQASDLLGRIGDPDLALDFATLDGRLHKDAWQRSEGEEARAHAQRSADAYASAFARFDKHYPAINAATMFLAAGNVAEARRFAEAALVRARADAVDYWSCATAAEASVILGDAAAAGEWLDSAAALSPGLDGVSTTRRQILFVARTVGIDAAVVARLPAAPVRYWCGEGASARAPQGESQPRLAPGIAFGAIVSVVDVSRAARLAAEGHEINLVMPCEPPAWLDSLGRVEAEAVRPDLENVLREAANVLFVTREGRPREPAALELCRRQARGLALLRAASLAVAAERLMWPAGETSAPALHPDDGAGTHLAADTTAAAPDDREARAIVFGDVRGFSRLGEADQLQFLDRIMGGFADVLAADRAVDYAETAGDGIYVVFADVASAARCCFGLRDVLDPARVADAGLPPHLGLRLSAHVGPIYRRFDRVIQRTKFCGSEVIRTARIEPVTPLGEIYVTEQFAAALSDAEGEAYACDYAGRQPMAKGFGECRMYALRRARG